MKRKFSILVVLTIIPFFIFSNKVYGALSNTSKSPYNITVNGKKVETDMLNFNGSNYIKISELADILDIDVSFDETTKTVALDKSKPYSGVRSIKSITLQFFPLPITPPTLSTHVEYIGIVVYDNTIYRQRRQDLSKLDETHIDEYLGEASGIIYEDTWTEESGLRSTCKGSVYSVKGYDKAFRICVKADNGSIILLENLCNITVSIGKDIFDDRLQMIDKYVEVTYQTQSDWDYGNDNHQRFKDFTNSDYDMFISELYKSEFVEIDEFKGTDNPLTSENQLHLHFIMKDNTVVSLHLYEGGYVRYDRLYGSDYSIVVSKMNPEGIFEKFLSETGL